MEADIELEPPLALERRVPLVPYPYGQQAPAEAPADVSPLPAA